MGERSDVVDRLAKWALAGARLAIDGPDTAGKTTLADELALAITRQRRPVVRASIDGFHRPAEERYLRGEFSPVGYYRDSFDMSRLWSHLLDPLGPGGNRIYRTAVFDHVADHPVAMPEAVAPENAVLVFDGVFLLTPSLASAWDQVIFLEIDQEEVLRRAESRDSRSIGGRFGPSVRERYLRRYLPAQRIYREEARPIERADVVIDNTDPDHPAVLKAPWD